MNITEIIERNRQKALLEGNYSAYKRHLTRQNHLVRKRLCISTSKNAKFSARGPVSAEDVAKNHEFITLLILGAERAWSSAWAVKLSRPETQEIRGSTRRYIISRFQKAIKHAKNLFAALAKQEVSGATDVDVLEAVAYVSCLAGAQELNKQAGQGFEDLTRKKLMWQSCLSSFSEAYIIYASLFKLTEKPIFKDFLETEVEQSIRYAAYQFGLPRTRATSEIAIEYCPRHNEVVMALIERVNPNAFLEQTSAVPNGLGLTANIPIVITWRSHTSPIVDAAIGQALAARSLAEENLKAAFANHELSPIKGDSLALSYDPVLTACQEAVDITRRSITELVKEGVPEPDSRMQHLRVADLETNHVLVRWRVGRNRVLIGGGKLNDGATFEIEPTNIPSWSKKDGNGWKPKSETQKHMLTRLQQRIVLYDATLQSIQSIKNLRGAARYEEFLDELEAQRGFFQSLKCLNIGFSYDLVGQYQKALAMYHRADRLVSAAASMMESISFGNPDDLSSPPTLAISKVQVDYLRNEISIKVTQYRGFASLQTFQSLDSHSLASRKIIQQLHEYPISGLIDLDSIVRYPPMLEPVPVKAIYLDLAWNHIEYLGRAADNENQLRERHNNRSEQNPISDPKVEGKGRRGWFSFGR